MLNDYGVNIVQKRLLARIVMSYSWPLGVLATLVSIDG